MLLENQLRSSWGLIEKGWDPVFRAHLLEIEAAKADRFFPRSLAWALRGMDAEGHFLDVRCGTIKKASACPPKREVLEKRVLAVTLLSVIPTGRPAADLFDGRTWELTPSGVAAFAAAERAFPGLWGRLRGLAARSLGARGGAPAAPVGAAATDD